MFERLKPGNEIDVIKKTAGLERTLGRKGEKQKSEKSQEKNVKNLSKKVTL